MLHSALAHLQAALDLLDCTAAPAEIGAHVDLAVHQLGSLMSSWAVDVAVTNVGEAAARH